MALNTCTPLFFSFVSSSKTNVPYGSFCIAVLYRLAVRGRTLHLVKRLESKGSLYCPWHSLVQEDKGWECCLRGDHMVSTPSSSSSSLSPWGTRQSLFWKGVWGPGTVLSCQPSLPRAQPASARDTVYASLTLMHPGPPASGFVCICEA